MVLFFISQNMLRIFFRVAGDCISNKTVILGISKNLSYVDTEIQVNVNLNKKASLKDKFFGKTEVRHISYITQYCMLKINKLFDKYSDMVKQ